MWSNIKRFDFHSKTMEALQSKSVFGGLITIVSVFLIFVLLVLEVREYRTPTILTNLNVDTTLDSQAPAVVDITLLNMKCSEVNLDFENLKVRPPENVIINKHPYLPDELHGLYNSGNPSLYPSCKLEAKFNLFNGQGSFHIPIHSGTINYGNDYHTHMYDRRALETFNASHIINNLYFGTFIESLNSPLNQHIEIVNNETQYNHFSYFIKIIPTTITTLRGSSTNTFQYSASIYRKKIEGMSMGNNVVPGIYFKYEFSPIQMSIEETRKSFFTFFTSICAIIGGIITVSRFVQAFVSRSTAALYKTD